MPLTERRYDRLAVRLSLIISRLVAGETLEMQKLATEFDVSVRTLYRDFRERLMYLDLECHQGCYRLRTGAGPQGELDVLTLHTGPGWSISFRGWTGVWRAHCWHRMEPLAWCGSHHSR